MQFRAFPLVRVVLCFAAGIICQHYLPNQFTLPFWLSLLLFGFSWIINLFFSRKLNLIFGTIVILLFFQLGVYQLKRTQHGFTKSFEYIEIDQVKKFKAALEEAPQRRAKSYQLKVKVYEVSIKDTSFSTNFKAILYGDTILSAQVQKGDLIEVSAALKKTQRPINPHSFDYRNYLVYQGVYFQNYIGDRFVKIGYRPSLVFEGAIDQVRNWALAVFDELISNKNAKQVAKALVLGERAALDNDVISAYASSGAMHVLAVSGLHVGLIYLLLGSVLKLIPFGPKYRNKLIAAISILVLFFYVVLTGLSPSVFRAFVMFSFFALAKAANRATNTYNILATSALVLLLFDPYLLFSVGFQLSYLAVIGIIYLQPKLYQLCEFKSWILDKLWAITCVSIAAQLATAPLSMLYFHQFPSYFLISNLFIIPAAFLILLLGLAILLFYPIEFISSILASILSGIIQVTNYLVFEVSKWWGGTIQNIQLSVLETWLIYGLIISLLLVFFEKQFKAIYVALMLSVGFALSQINQRVPISRSNELMVYAISGHQAIEFRMGSNSTIIMDKELMNDLDVFQFNILPNQRWNHIQDSLKLSSRNIDMNKVVVFNRKTALILNSKFNVSPALSDIHWDVVFASHPKQIKMLKADEIVLNSNHRLAQNDDSSIHVLNRDGFYSNLWK